MKTDAIREWFKITDRTHDTLAEAWREVEDIECVRAHLRDTFATAALTGLLADSTVDFKTAETYATKSYEMADAMLKAREGK